MLIAETPEPPYYAVIFSSTLKPGPEGYGETAGRMLDLARVQKGYLGYEAARNGLGISISYWKDLESIRRWKNQYEHLVAQQKGMSNWYQTYKVRVCRVERDYGFEAPEETR